MARPDLAVEVWRGCVNVRHATARFGVAVEAGKGLVWPGKAGFGSSWRSRLVVMARLGGARYGQARQSGKGLARQGVYRLGSARRPRIGVVRRGLVEHGTARRSG